MKILVLGAGGLGGYFGGRLAQAGADVTFLVRKHRQELLAAHGLRIRSKFGDYSGPVKTALEHEVAGTPWDVIILSCKAYDLDSAIETIRPAVGAKTAVLPLLNGVRHLQHLNDVFGKTHVLGGLAKIVSMVDAEGIVHHLNDWCAITFGEQDGRISERVTRLQALFPADSVKASAVPDIQQKMWEKFVHLATVAGIASLMRASVGEIARVPGGTELLIHFLESNAAVAKAEGHPIPESFLKEYRDLFHDQQLPYVPSLLRDVERHNRCEGDHILGHMLALVNKHHMEPTLHELIHMNLQTYEVRRQAGRF
ncbi:2-dehydropantoate 2-reductase [Castellaniella caeni]|uniref:2-dehydropantoate 2-reductase n=1 Tax=Castellaniella caeni TaxID=266123 RepID=UPI00083278E0|nr:2-dehydropantoate 2-reductase [Castellaniella caeni]